ncbi:tetratricopeptide repeat protein [Flavobacterium collinsii]|uniref:Tetratricopeptide repeat protein n=1 Tax=Flavobacterium collinsii TaxID=1114861 RepID=A0ABN7ELU5_9FLAO|nr:hypothetical protein [Flavobacterium collinsii]CAA9199178.1 hypothetical protein FLACOL7796_02587 [Flavobacterium collinsii]
MKKEELPSYQILAASEIEKKIGKLPPPSRFYIYDEDEDEDDTENPDMLYFDGDVTLSENQLKTLKEKDYHFNIAVKGNLTLEGHFHTGCNNLWVTGNLYCDSLANTASLRVKGKITARYFVSFLAEDHEVLWTTSKLKIETPYVFSWFYDLSNIKLNRDAIVFILCDGSDYQKMAFKNPCFFWHSEIFVLKPELLYPIYYGAVDDSPIWNFDMISQTLQKDESIFIEGFNPDSLLLEEQAKEYTRLQRSKEAFAIRKQQLALSPAYYDPYFRAGILLFNTGAYEQAIPYLDTAANLFPDKFKNLSNQAADFTALARIRLRQLDEAVKWADFSIGDKKTDRDKNKDAYDYYNEEDKLHFSYRVRAEAYLLKGDWNKAKSDLETALDIMHDHSSSNWLMGLVFHHFGDAQNAKKYHDLAKKTNKRFEADYDINNSSDFFYKAPTKVNWTDENIEVTEIVQDGAYWLDYLKREGYEEFNKVPKEYRTLDFCINAIKMIRSGYIVSIAKYFPKDLLETNELIEALLEHSICSLNYVPKKCITKELLLKSKGDFLDPKYIPAGLWDQELCDWAVTVTSELNKLPKHLLNYNLCLKAVQHKTHSIENVPDQYRDEHMYLTALAYSYQKSHYIPSLYYSSEMICKAIDINPMAIDRISGKYINEHVFNHAKNSIDPDIFAQLARKHSTNFREHINHPRLADACWAVFWDEKLLLSEIVQKYTGISGSDIPKEKYTQAIADAFLKHHPYELMYVPKKFISAEIAKEVLKKRDFTENFPRIGDFSKSVRKVIRSYSDSNK